MSQNNINNSHGHMFLEGFIESMPNAGSFHQWTSVGAAFGTLSVAHEALPDSFTADHPLAPLAIAVAGGFAAFLAIRQYAVHTIGIDRYHRAKGW